MVVEKGVKGRPLATDRGDDQPGPTAALLQHARADYRVVRPWVVAHGSRRSVPQGGMDEVLRPMADGDLILTGPAALSIDEMRGRWDCLDPAGLSATRLIRDSLEASDAP